MFVVEAEGLGRRFDAGAGADAELAVDLGRVAHGDNLLADVLHNPYPNDVGEQPGTDRGPPLPSPPKAYPMPKRANEAQLR